jgi:GTPase SAR1 family protein
MAVTQLYELDGVSITTTEWDVAQNESFTVNSTSLNTDAAAIQLWLDTTDFVKADEMQIRLYEKVEATGGAQRLTAQWNLLGVQATNWVSPVFLVMNGWAWTLDCLAGTSITVDASIRKAG